ncbi:MAG: hypothetical protein Kow0069_28090 [Promethearchaeota archaeon]
MNDQWCVVLKNPSFLSIQVQVTTSSQLLLRVFNVQRSCVHDGPGLRTTIFFQGCELRCAWCQNPEGQAIRGGPWTKRESIEDLLAVVRRDAQYLTATGGGVTLSGGEPLLQDPEALVELLGALADEGIKVAVETSLQAPWGTVERVAPLVDLFLVDLKVVGDEATHRRLTGKSDVLVRENVAKLLESGARVKFRMVVVPGHNDADERVRAAADYLRSLGHNSLELLQFHDVYEEKLPRFGLSRPSLGIKPDVARAAVEAAVAKFAERGVTAELVDAQDPRRPNQFTDRVLRVREDIRRAGRALCFEAARLKTQYYRKHGFDAPTHVHRAGRLAHMLRHKSLHVYPGELLVGTFTSKRVAGQLWEEYYGTLNVLFLYKLNFQKPIPFQCTLKERLHFYARIFPFWTNRCLYHRVNRTLRDFLAAIARNSELKVGFNNNMAAIAHFVVNFKRLLELGTTGIKRELAEGAARNPQRADFYLGATIALEGLEEYAARYADYLERLASEEADEVRRLELEQMAGVCRRVPKHPARTFHEALQAIVFLQVALCLESYENAISFGRLDQVLQPYYEADVKAGRITYQKAKELLCLFVLKMDECVFVNDGESFLALSKMFETISTDQAVTFGGVDSEGNDATNDVTLMLVEACELQPLSLDFGARVHAGSPPEYLEKIAQVYLNGVPVPQLFSDDVYVDAILRHYPVSVEQARNYAIVGCVEPNASDDHFGNTDCANVNLAVPLLQALKGHDQDPWNHPLVDQVLLIVTNFVKWFARWIMKDRWPAKRLVRVCNALRIRRNAKRGFYQYDPPATMEELLDRFQERLNHVTRQVLSEHQRIEGVLRAHFTTPLASSLFPGCVESGKDLYEGGASINSSGIQAVGVTDVADSLHAIEEVVFKRRLFTMEEVLRATAANFRGKRYQRVREALLAVPKFGDDSSTRASWWVTRVMAAWNEALDSVPNCPRGGRYSAGYYALNVANRYGRKTPALPSGRKFGVPLANSITPHYGMRQADLLSALNSMAKVNFAEHAENGATATLTIDSAMFRGPDGPKKLAALFRTYLTSGGMQLQPNVIDRRVLLEAYEHPEKHPYLLVRIAGYCAYFHELSDEMKRTIINRTCYSA